MDGNLDSYLNLSSLGYVTVQGEVYQHCSSLHIAELPQNYYIWVIYIYTSLREHQGCLRIADAVN